MNKEETVKRFLELFPEKKNAYTEHLSKFGELLQHPFYAENINIPLKALLEHNHDTAEIQKYCKLIEAMVQEGDGDVKNVADVTILECLSDDKEIWHRFGTYISNDLIRYINTVLLRENIAMRGVARLVYHGRKRDNG